MLSYQHAYHAGNAADLHKHLALVMLLRRLGRKEAPYCFVDAHAGRALYDLTGDEARKTGEAEQGILRLAAAAGIHGAADAAAATGVRAAADAAAAAAVHGAADAAGAAHADGPADGVAARAAAADADPPAAVRDYLDLVAAFNPGGGLSCYPGSPALARALLRPQDRAILLELHPQEFAALKAAVASDRRLGLHARDCYEGLPALLPPPIRRGLVLIDPSYERKTEYADVVRLLDRAHRRWATAVWMLWYPLLRDARDRQLRQGLADLALPKVLIDEFRFADAGIGLQGSGLVIVNTPWQFETDLAAAMRWVAAALALVPEKALSQRFTGSS